MTKVAGLDVADPELAAGGGRKRHEAADLDVVGADRVLGAGELLLARTIITFEPIPSTRAPILQSSRARSCTCGSQAAFPITVLPGASAAAGSAFSVPITEGSSMKISQARADRWGR